MKKKEKIKVPNRNGCFTKDDAFKTLDTVNMWIGNCDLKASVLLASVGIIMTIVFTSDLFSPIKQQVINSFLDICGWKWLYSIFMWISLASIILGIGCLIKTITPKILLTYEIKKIIRQETVIEEKEFDSVMFYGTVAKKDFESYRQQIDNINDEKIINDLYFQINSASKICNNKFNNLKRGIVLFFGGLVLFIILIFVSNVI